MTKVSDWIIGSILLVIIVIFVFISFFRVSSGGGYRFTDNRVGIIEINGLIYDSEPVVNQLKRFSSHDAIKSILIRIESPGGVIAPTQEIYNEIKRVENMGIPVVASIGMIGASGGYYIACACDTIVANPGSITGSIGVVMEFSDFQGILEKLGIRFDVIKSGKYKDSGSPFREMTKDEKELFQNLVYDSYDQFVEVVALERDLPEEEVKRLADGRIYTGRQAFEQGLVDVLGGYEEAVSIAKRLGGLPSRAKIYKEKRKKFTILDLIFGDINDNINFLKSRKYNLKY